MQIKNFPQNREGKMLEKMILTGFNPLKTLIEYEKLQDDLTPEDIHLLVHAIGEGLNSWIIYLKRVNEAKMNRRED